MTEIERLTDQLQREFDGDPWHGPSLTFLLKGVSVEEAARRPAPDSHSIFELVLHITGWKREVASRLRGRAAGEPAAGDWPSVGEPSDARWRAAKRDLARAHREVLAALRDLPARRLHQPVSDARRREAGTGMTFYQTVLGLLQHDLYHAGQIAILRKILPSRPVGPIMKKP